MPIVQHKNFCHRQHKHHVDAQIFFPSVPLVAICRLYKLVQLPPILLTTLLFLSRMVTKPVPSALRSGERNTAAYK